MDLKTFRQEKDEYFRHPSSPLTDLQRQQFKGLQYFPENDALRFSLVLDEKVDHTLVTMQTSTGEVREYRVAGDIHFQVKGQNVVFKIYEDENGYFLPFRDGSCEKESYSAGRYLEPEKQKDGKLLVDFNLACNPYCAYNEHYSCPFPPRDNWTDLRIEAGEKKFHD